VADNIFGISHEEFIRNQREMYYDRKHDASLQQVAEQAAAGETAGAMAGGGDLGGDLGADLGGDLGGEEGALGAGGPEEMPAGDAGAEGDESALLAAPPGSRSSPRLTPGSKGKVYTPVKSDKRPAGARTRSYSSKYSKEKSSPAIRNIMPGYADLKTLTKMDGVSTGIYEQDVSIYNLREEKEETRLFQISESMRNLLTDLENNKDQDDENKTQ
jgi:hypothetical protein